MKLLLFLSLCLYDLPVFADAANPLDDYEVPFRSGLLFMILSCISCLVIALLLHFCVKKKVSKNKFFWCFVVPCLCIVCLITKAEYDISNGLCSSKTDFSDGLYSSKTDFSEDLYYDPFYDFCLIGEESPECKRQEEERKEREEERKEREAEYEFCKQQHWQFNIVKLFKLK